MKIADYRRNEDLQEKQNVVEISLPDFFKKILIQWRAVLVFSLIVGLAVSGLKYVRDRSSYRAAVEKEDGAEAGATDIESIESDLTADEIEAVQQAVLQKREIEELNTYIAESVYMNIDAMNSKRLTLLYYIQADQGGDAADLLTVYRNILRTDDSLKAIRRASGIKSSIKYMRELLTVYDDKLTDRGAITKATSTDVMSVVFYLPEGTDDTDAKAVENTIDNLIQNYEISQTGILGGNVRKICSETNEDIDSTIRNNQNNLMNEISSLKSNYNSATASFSDEQNKLLYAMFKENGIEEMTSGDEIRDTDRPASPSFSVKYFVVGFILGFILFAFFELIHDILSSKCSSVTRNSGLKLGTAVDLGRKKTNFLFTDRLLMKALYKKQADLNFVIERILTQAQMNSSKEKLSEFELWTVGFDGASSPAVQKLIADAGQSGIEVTATSTDDRNPDIMIGEAVRDKSVALVVQDGKSRKKDASFLAEMLLIKDTDYLGQIELL